MKLLTVDLESPLPRIPPPVQGEQWVLVRFHREPLGMLHFAGRGCTPAELARAIAERFSPRLLRHLAADRFRGGEPPRAGHLPAECPRLVARDLPTISAAVCTRDGAARLPPCLDSLVALRYPQDRLDLLVVDNAPSDGDTRELVETRYPGIRYVIEPRPGLDWARNRAVLESRGDVIAFTDDDVTLDPWWADAIGRLFLEEPDAVALTGLVVPDEIDVEAQRLFECYGGFNRGYQRQYFRVDSAAGEATTPRHGGAGRFGTGANMAFRRSVFERIGLFDPALDVGTVANGGGDLEMFFRVLKEGGTLVYDPTAIARHRHRRTYEELRTQLTNNGIGFYAFLARTAGTYPDERWPIVRLAMWWLWWWSARRLLRSFLGREALPRDLILAELTGSLAGVRRYGAAARGAREIAGAFGPQGPYAAASDGV